MKSLLLLLSMACIHHAVGQDIKGFYVDDFDGILGNVVKEDSLLLFAKDNQFNYLTLYDVHTVHNATPLTNVATAETFANFIKKAKTTYGIQEVGVAAENYWFFENVVHIYNQQHADPLQKVDVYNFEFEFWIPASVAAGSYYCTTYLTPNGYPCNEAGAFNFYRNELRKIDSLANTIGKKSEAYFGFFNTEQAAQIVATQVDRILLSAYLPSAVYTPTYQYEYLKPRLQALGAAGTTVQVMPLYSAENSFMHTWVDANPYFKPYTDLVDKLGTVTEPFESFVQMKGIQWFAYSHLPKRYAVTSISNPSYTQDEVIDFAIFPNPAKDIIIISLEEGNHNKDTYITITDMLGKELIKQTMTNTTQLLDIGELQNGIYFLSIDMKGKRTIKKLVVD